VLIKISRVCKGKDLGELVFEMILLTSSVGNARSSEICGERMGEERTEKVYMRRQDKFSQKFVRIGNSLEFMIRGQR